MANLTNAEATSKLNFSVLTDDDCDKIIETAYRILEEVGWKIAEDENHEGRDTLQKAGCHVDGDNILFPRDLVKRCIDQVPREFVFYDQLGNEALRMNAKTPHTYMADGSFTPFRMDLETGERRDTRLQDAFETALVCDALPNIDYVASMSWNKDVPYEELTGLYDARKLLEATNKPVWLYTFGKTDDKFMREMVAAVAGSWEKFIEKPFFMFTSTIKEADRAIDMFKLGTPVWTGGEAFPGGTSPIYLAGSIAQGLAEAFANLTFAQVFHPGLPCMTDIGLNTMNLNTAGFAGTSPEEVLAGAAITQILRYIGLPNMYHFTMTDAPTLDAQAAADYMANLLIAKECGSNIAYFSGFLEAANTGSMEAIVLGNEIAGYLNHLLGGVEVNDETLAFDAIKRVGPCGNFITDQTTFEGMYDYWGPGMFKRESWAQFVEGGKKEFNQRANEWCREIIAQGVQHPKDPQVITTLDEILTRAEKEYADAH